MNNLKKYFSQHPSVARCVELGLVALMPLLFAMQILGLWHWDFSVPLVMGGHDEVWQLVLSKMVRDGTWVLESPFMGAPDMAHWQYHSAAQTSSLHSMIMWVMSFFIDDAIRIQQTYYLLNFSLIALTSYLVSRTFGLRRFAAAAVAALYCFTTFRINCMFYSFLSNYAAVPLAFVPVLWIMKGEFAAFFDKAANVRAGLRDTFRSRKFWIALACALVVSLSDGYYAFFSLLLLGFVIAVRAVGGDILRPATLIAPIAIIAALGGLAVTMTLPLSKYQNSHMDEFYQDGKLDPALMRHVYEAEVYSSSLKLMIAPIKNHNIASLGAMGKYMVETSDAARKYPIMQPIVSLGSIGTILFFASLMCLAVLIFKKSGLPSSRTGMLPYLENNSTFWCTVVLSIFIFLCATSGGIGSLIGFFYPTIRAYERFPLFLLFSLFIGAGAVLSAMVRLASTPERAKKIMVYTFWIAMAGLYDQIPNDAAKGDEKNVAKFMNERAFIANVEAGLPARAMVYQYPHSQYLDDSKYYGWGSFDQIRFYLHSKNLRWSNGASKNSPVENWHNRIAGLPAEQLLREVESVGFRGMVIDRPVVPAAEYQALRTAALKRGWNVEEDPKSKLAYVKLPVAAVSVVYDAKFKEIDRVIVNDVSRLGSAQFPRLVNAARVKQMIASMPVSAKPITIERAAHPELFFTAAGLERGSGEKPVLPLTDMAGTMKCVRLPAADGTSSDTVQLTLTNASTFDWQLDAGKLPFKIGVHLQKPDGTLLLWDNGLRIPTGGYLAHGDSASYTFPLAGITRTGMTEPYDKPVAEFGLVQDGHAWFANFNCKLPL